VIQHVGNVLHHDCEGSARVNIFEIVDVEPGSWIVSKSFGMIGHFSEFGTTDTSKGLTRGPPNDHVEGEGRISQAQLFRKFRRLNISDVASLLMRFGAAMKVCAVRLRSVRIGFDCGDDVKAGSLKAE
jgi:hypothetical protein